MPFDLADAAAVIAAAYEDRRLVAGRDVRAAVEQTLQGLDSGELRVAEKIDGAWVVNDWIKQAIVLSFLMNDNVASHAGPLAFFDKAPMKTHWRNTGVRVVPPGCARYGSFLEPGVILMPAFVNIGARVGAGTMIDTWATVGSCAQIGANVHLSGGVGIGGVLEPPSARPVIIEDGAFIGSRCIVVEGVVVEKEAVLGAGVVLTASTPIIDVTGPKPVTHTATVPARAVVIGGSQPKAFAAGTFHTPSALIIGQRSESTDRKTSLNAALREHGVSV
ncbi:MAG TPA: 2,3,4,5-tetrahydropyridine-2,6-dicarboxylate N-succinyltransferase [Candidatus Eremiobacteraceae bacterium]|nr:2,3,4,5-tetrahydropyridine-2,6-dicarboxylate N-succinyltransferase [Candidatus Eremiobacteraceae bacterium]